MVNCIITGAGIASKVAGSYLLRAVSAALCYYYSAYNVHKAIRRCQNGIYHEGKDGFLVYFLSIHSLAMAPPGHYAMTIYTITPNRLNEGTWSERKEEYNHSPFMHGLFNIHSTNVKFTFHTY